MVTQKLGETEVTVARARQITSKNGVINARSELANFMSLIDELLEHGLIEEGKEFTVSEEEDTVILDVNKINKAVKKANLYTRRWAVRNQLEMFGFESIKKGSGSVYKGSYAVWKRLMGKIITLKSRQTRRDQKFAK